MSLVDLAKLAVESYIKEGKIISVPKDLDQEFLNKQAGTFVTIEKRLNSHKVLRGCIGTYLPTRKNIALEVIYNAIAAATEDYRFGRVSQLELPDLVYTVYILSKPELVKTKTELNPKKYGIIVKTTPITSSSNVTFNGKVPVKTGLLLPDLEGVDTVEKQISIACLKAGIDLSREKIVIYRFKVEKYHSKCKI